MWTFPWLPAGGLWGWALYQAIRPREGGSFLSRVAGWFVAGQIGRLTTAQRRQIEAAGIAPERIVQWTLSVTFVLTFILSPLLAVFFHLGLWGAVAGFLVAAFVGWSVPLWAAAGPYRRWQFEMASGLPTFVGFLPLFLSAGYPPRRALDEAVRLTPEPLRSELDRALEPVRRTGRAQEAFENFTARAGIPELDTLLGRLTLLWNQRIPPEILADLDQQFGAVRDVAAARTLTVVKGQAILLVFSLILFVASLGAGALLQWVGGALHVVLGM